MKLFKVNHIVALAIMGSFLFANSAYAEKVSPKTVQGATTVDTAQAKKLWQDGAAFLDTRKQSDWDAGHIPEAMHIDRKNKAKYNEAAVEALMPNKSKPVVTYCNGTECMRSSETATELVKWGYSKVYYYRNGFPAWKAANNPVE